MKQESVGEKKKKKERSRFQDVLEGRNGGVKLVMEGHTDCWLQGLWSKGRAVRRCNPEDLSAAKSYLCGILCDWAVAGFGGVLYRNMPQTRPAHTEFSIHTGFIYFESAVFLFFYFCCKGCDFFGAQRDSSPPPQQNVQHLIVSHAYFSFILSLALCQSACFVGEKFVLRSIAGTSAKVFFYFFFFFFDEVAKLCKMCWNWLDPHSWSWLSYRAAISASLCIWGWIFKKKKTTKYTVQTVFFY